MVPMPFLFNNTDLPQIKTQDRKHSSPPWPPASEATAQLATSFSKIPISVTSLSAQKIAKILQDQLA
ncbi:hypothetical protein BDW72DRAFT_164692 [Aspergillus terricola var. indicus]